MSKPKATVIEESAIARTEPLPQIPTDMQSPSEPSWDRARAYVDDVRRSILAVISLGLEIKALKDQYEAQGARTDINGVTSISANIVKGWKEKVQDELGIHFNTAYRIMERAESLVFMRRIEMGESVEYADSRTKEARTLESTPELQEQATRAIECVVAGTVAAPRAWAGLVGEASRRSQQGGSANRAATDHAANIRTAIIKLRSSLRSWKTLAPRDRMELEFLWKEVASKLPETWTAE